MAQAVEEWYKQMPIITRSYLTAAVVTTVGCSLEVLFASSFFEKRFDSLLKRMWIDMDVFRIMFLNC